MKGTLRGALRRMETGGLAGDMAAWRRMREREDPEEAERREQRRETAARVAGHGALAVLKGAAFISLSLVLGIFGAAFKQNPPGR